MVVIVFQFLFAPPGILYMDVWMFLQFASLMQHKDKNSEQSLIYMYNT